MMKTATRLLTTAAAALALAAPATAAAADYAHSSLAAERATVSLRVQARLAQLLPGYLPAVQRCTPLQHVRPVLRWSCLVDFLPNGTAYHATYAVTITRDGRTVHAPSTHLLPGAR